MHSCAEFYKSVLVFRARSAQLTHIPTHPGSHGLRSASLFRCAQWRDLGVRRSQSANSGAVTPFGMTDGCCFASSNCSYGRIVSFTSLIPILLFRHLRHLRQVRHPKRVYGPKLQKSLRSCLSQSNVSNPSKRDHCPSHHSKFIAPQPSIP
jgi:hypothetical protein